MKKIVVSQPVPPAVPGAAAGGVVDSLVDKLFNKVTEKGSVDLNKDTSGGSSLEYYTEFNELANTFKNVFNVTDPTYTDAEKLREHFLNTPVARDPDGILNFIRLLKDTLFAISGYSRFEPNIAQLLANFAITLLDRTRSFDQVNRKLEDIKTKASDTERPKDAYIIALLKGDYQTANLLLLLSDIGQIVSKQTLQDIQSTQQLANKLLGPKSQELINAQYLDNELAAGNAAEINNSLAKFQAMIPIGAQRARWRQQVNQFAENAFQSDSIKKLMASPVVTNLGAAAGGFGAFKDVYKMPLKDIFGGK